MFILLPMNVIEREIENRHTRARLIAAASRILGNAADAEDCVQEALIAAARNAAQFEGRSSPTSWLYRVVVNACRMQRRAMRRERRGGTNVHVPLDDLVFEQPTGGDDPEDMIQGRDTLAVVLDELARVPPRDAALFERHVVEDLPLRILAEESRLTRQALKARLFRVRRRLAERLEAAHLARSA
jgi:RNA polymerase sigma-70 factor (ECF subfamily)